MTRPEFWLPIPDWPGYEISSRGRARSLDRIVVDRRGHRRRWRGRLLKAHTSPHGGTSVALSRCGQAKSMNVNTLWRRAASKPAENRGNTPASPNGRRRPKISERKKP